MSATAHADEPLVEVTGFRALDRHLQGIVDVPEGSLGRRAFYAFLLVAGIVTSALGSYLFSLVPPISYKLIPDLRIAALVLTGAFFGFQAAFGGHRARALALWGTVGYVILFHLEEATIHWIGPVPGSITGTRVGLVGTAGSLLSLVAILLLHVEDEAARLRRDLRRRGADPVDIESTVAALARDGRRTCVGIGAATGAFGIFIFVAEKVVGDSATGGSWVLLLGGALLLVLALYLMRLLPSGRA